MTLFAEKGKALLVTLDNIGSLALSDGRRVTEAFKEGQLAEDTPVLRELTYEVCDERDCVNVNDSDKLESNLSRRLEETETVVLVNDDDLFAITEDTESLRITSFESLLEKKVVFSTVADSWSIKPVDSELNLVEYSEVMDDVRTEKLVLVKANETEFLRLRVVVTEPRNEGPLEEKALRFTDGVSLCTSVNVDVFRLGEGETLKE